MSAFRPFLEDSACLASKAAHMALERAGIQGKDLESLTTLREKLVKIGAKVVRHGRYITFQMTEVAIPRTLFAEILRLIDRLRPASLPP